MNFDDSNEFEVHKRNLAEQLYNINFESGWQVLHHLMFKGDKRHYWHLVKKIK